MLDSTRLKVGTGVRVRDFLSAYPMDHQPAELVAARFAAQVERAQVLLTQRESGAAASKASTARRRTLKTDMVGGPLRHVNRITKAVDRDEPGRVKVRANVGKLGHEDFQATARAISQDVEAEKGLYLQHGLSEESLEELNTMLAQYDTAVVEGNAGRRASTGATAELKVVTRDLMRMLQQLDGIIMYRYRDQPEVLGAWQSARNIAWPVVKPEAPSGGGGKAA
jgi:hypothetical protein